MTSAIVDILKFKNPEASSKNESSLHQIMSERTNAVKAKSDIIKSMPDEGSSFEKTLRGIIGPDRPIGPWGAAMASIFDSATSKKKEELIKQAKTLSDIEETGAQANKQQQESLKQKKAQEDIAPSLKTYLKQADKLSPRDREDFLRKIVDRFNASSGEDWKLVSVDGNDPTNVTLASPTRGVAPISLLDSPIGKDLRNDMETERLTKLAEDNSQQQIENETMKANASMVSANASGRRAALEAELQPYQMDKLKKENRKLDFETSSSEENIYGSIPKAGLSRGAETAYTKTANAEQSAAKEIPLAIKLMNDAEKLVLDDKDQFSGLDALMGNISPSLMSTSAREKYERLDKDRNRVATIYIKAMSAQGQVVEGLQDSIKEGIFKPKGLDATNRYNIETTKKELVQSYIRGKFTASELEKGRFSTANSFEKYLEANPDILKKTARELGIYDNEMLKLEAKVKREKAEEILIEDPDTGEKRMLPIDKARKVVSNGGILG